MENNLFNKFVEERAREMESRRKSNYENYIEEFIRILKNNQSLEEDFCSEVICCPEPLEFIKFFEYATDRKDCQKIMQDLILGRQENAPKFKRIKLNEKIMEDGIWVHGTANGINLRPGKQENKVDKLITLNDDIVHAVIVGRTGSGKSVFLNHLIMTMLHEYAPWELDLYLADFKKVELSRYMSDKDAVTPHVRTCAATSEIRYMVSMLEHLYACMKARQNLLAKLGVQKLSEFRSKFGIVLPRVILLVDEFQQMYEEAGNREGNQIRSLIHSIIKLGRATGFHLIFASQEMSGALVGNELANFKARFALSCDAAISSTILGNSEASKLDRGFVIANTNFCANNVNNNEKYQVPFIEADDKVFDEVNDIKSYFYESLEYFCKKAKECGFSKQQIFYQEDEQKELQEFEEKVLNKIKEERADRLKKLKNQYYDIITLGHGVVYSKKKNDLESFFIERGHNKNILAICHDIVDLVYIQKLMALNFKYSLSYMKNIYYDFNLLLSNRYDISEDLNDIEKRKEEELGKIKKEYDKRLAIQIAAKKETLKEFLEEYISLSFQFGWILKKEQILNQAMVLLENFDEEELYETSIKLYNNPKSWTTYPIACYYWNKIEKKDWNEIFEPINIWISGLEYTTQDLPKYLSEIMKKGMEVNMLFLLFASSIESYKNLDPVSVCDYLFAKGEQEIIYNKLKMNFDKRSKNDIVIDFKIKSLNTERALKKYRTKFNEFEVPELNFDALLDIEQ